jgi:hypothetical protein
LAGINRRIELQTGPDKKCETLLEK